MATIVYVHGNGNKIASAALKLQWDQELFGRDLGASSRMAYWAPICHPQPLATPEMEETEQLPGSPLEATVGPDVKPPEMFAAEVMREAQAEVAAHPAVETAGIEAAVPKQLESWLRDLIYTSDALADGENAAPPVTSTFEALPFPKRMRKAAFRALVKRTFKDVYAYFFGGRGDAMRQVVRDTLTGVHGPTVVLGHSLGSILAYDVLREPAAAGLDVPLFVTVGSPLGVTEIQDLVTHPLQVPAPVRHWRNASDSRDLVALDHTIRPEFTPADRCADFFVTNDSGSHHGIGEYLRTVPVRQPILQLFQQ